MYELPVATLTNYHKLGQLEQQEVIVSQFWRPEICSLGVLFLKALGEDALCLFQLLWLLGLPPPSLISVSPFYLFFSLSLSLSFFKDTSRYNSIIKDH